MPGLAAAFIGMARRDLLALLLVAACASPPPAPLPAREPTAQPAGPAPLTVMTFNIQYGTRGLDRVSQVLSDSHADVIALEEVDRNVARSGKVDQVEVLTRATGLHAAFVPHRKLGGGQTGLLLLSRWPIERYERNGVSGSVLAHLSARTGPLEVIVVHTTSTDLANPGPRARRRASEVAAILRTAKRTRPALVLGDFNDDAPDSPTYRSMAAHFADACPAAGATWPDVLPVVRIDHVWLGAGWRALSCRTGADGASDHVPVMARIVPDPAP